MLSLNIGLYGLFESKIGLPSLCPNNGPLIEPWWHGYFWKWQYELDGTDLADWCNVEWNYSNPC